MNPIPFTPFVDPLMLYSKKYNKNMRQGEFFEPYKYYLPQSGDRIFFSKKGFFEYLKRISENPQDKILLSEHLKLSKEQLESLQKIKEVQEGRICSIFNHQIKPKQGIEITVFELKIRFGEDNFDEDDFQLEEDEDEEMEDKKKENETVELFIKYVETPVCDAKRFLVLKSVLEYTKNEAQKKLKIQTPVTIYLNNNEEVYKARIVKINDYVENTNYNGLQNDRIGDFHSILVKWVYEDDEPKVYTEDQFNSDDFLYVSCWEILEVGTPVDVYNYQSQKYHVFSNSLKAKMLKHIQPVYNTFRKLGSYTGNLSNIPYPITFDTVLHRLGNGFYRSHSSFFKEYEHLKKVLHTLYPNQIAQLQYFDQIFLKVEKACKPKISGKLFDLDDELLRICPEKKF